MARTVTVAVNRVDGKLLMAFSLKMGTGLFFPRSPENRPVPNCSFWRARHFPPWTGNIPSMQPVVQEALADDALLRTWRGGRHPERWGDYGDCFSALIDRPVPLADFVVAFYTTPLFRIERLILRLLAASPSTDEEIRQLLAGTRNTFAAWELSA